MSAVESANNWFDQGPVRWGRSRRFATVIARLFKPLSPPVLVISMPRSGSTWTAEMLGLARNAMYLFEPLTKSLIAFQGPSAQTNFRVDSSAPPSDYEHWADLAFNGVPCFPPAVTRFPAQWRLSSRTKRRVIVKEINLRAGPWLMQRYCPRLILLVRHPAAALLSSQQLGWRSRGLEIARQYGNKQGRDLRTMLDHLETYPAHQIVTYEELCIDPITLFKKLYDFAGLAWSPAIETQVAEHSLGGDRSESFGTYRNSSAMSNAWKKNMPANEVAALRDTFEAYDLPWYRDDKDW